MLLQVVCVRDRAAGAFGQPNFVLSIGGATRGFVDSVNTADGNNVMHKHPEDFEFYHLGTFDDQDGKFELFDRPRMICVAKDVIK